MSGWRLPKGWVCDLVLGAFSVASSAGWTLRLMGSEPPKGMPTGGTGLPVTPTQESPLSPSPLCTNAVKLNVPLQVDLGGEKLLRLYQGTFANGPLAPCPLQMQASPRAAPARPSASAVLPATFCPWALPGDDRRAVLQGGMPRSASAFLGVAPHWATVTSSFLLTLIAVFRGSLIWFASQFLCSPWGHWEAAPTGGAAPHGDLHRDRAPLIHSVQQSFL